MFPFKKKDRQGKPVDSAHIDEIEAHKKAIKKAAAGATSASEKLKETMVSNGFTVIIAASMGAKRMNGHGH